ncbi:urease accessory protein UreF (plasmid) [Roseomonas marmotae]|uniref:Urease accessory protein UreF n=2 Tax=Roseomonas marmotae TaxID=2768161 RepID=A0ABS3KDK5_9PROT|nr:urease accessory UreF family protein [Roseomonas marmotae]MBO1075522.1 urease accessory protein UreF [Roseomonas marmotae]QTI81515.1 urease accessory protein UreF [Roseomonas marmotae]
MVHLARLLQFSDSTLPIGSFAFSNGLESALQTRIVTDPESLLDYVTLILRQTARMDGIALLHAHRSARSGRYDEVLQADGELYCRRVGEEQQLMLTRVGKKFAELVLSILPSPTLGRWLTDIKAGATPGCLPVGQGVALAHMGVDEVEAFVMHQYGIASMILSAALRLMRIDHVGTQRILFAAQARVEGDYLAVRDLSLDEMASFSPVFDVLVAHHTTTHVRLFMN